MRVRPSPFEARGATERSVIVVQGALAVNSVLMANVREAIRDIWALRQFAVRDIGLPAFKEEIMRLIDASLRVEAAGAG